MITSVAGQKKKIPSTNGSLNAYPDQITSRSESGFGTELMPPMK